MEDFTMCSARANPKPAIVASYSDSLFVVEKLNLMAYWIVKPLGASNMSPALLLELFDAPSM
ncbi:hypothetical protein Scep_029571 [Stephania cephalantha]|uniref:Uncharacterized protein n=1 Tax=Stephania cephalantha TaxID=152367 RepID=A0AAP0HHS1_9MAGN